MAIETNCAGCGQKLSVADENAGKRARCPACGQIYTIPSVATPGPSVATPGRISESNPALAKTTAIDEGSANAVAQSSQQPALPTEQFWMRTGDGNEYGPVDRANLNRWFSEGRIGAGYEIRIGDQGPWQPADIFRPGQATSTTNPYAASASGPVVATSAAPVGAIGRFQKQDPSALVLTMGILAWVCLLLCWPISWIPGLIAWISGRTALQNIQSGVADPSNVTLVQVGYYLGMVQVIISMLVVIAIFGVIGVSMIAGL